MNERIKNLVYEAEEYALDKANEHDGDEDYEYTFEDDFQEKFAELIVRECADIAKHHVMNISTYADAEFVNEQIKEHFGVEE